MISPAGHRVLVKVDEVEKVTKGGIIITDTIADRKQEAGIYGTVVAVGPTAWKAFDDGIPWAAVGDKVAFAKYGGFIIEDPNTGDHYRLLNDEDVVAVIK